MLRNSQSRISLLALIAAGSLAITAGASVAQTAQRAEATVPAPATAAPVQIEIPRLDGIIGAPSPDLLPPPASAATANAAPAPAPASTVPAAVEPPAPAFALATELTERITKDRTAAAKEDRDAALKFYEARKGAPVWVTESGLTAPAQALITEIGKAGDYGLVADAFKLPAALPANAPRADLADAEATLTLAALKYARHARGGRMDPAALSRAIDRKAQLLPAAKVLDELAASNTPDQTLRRYHPQNPQFEKLRLKYVALRAGQPVVDAPPPAPAPVATTDAKGKAKKLAGTPVAKVMSPAALEKKLIANMEMWRWMPEMGGTYINPNIPEYTVSVWRDGKLIHKERIVTGKPDTMTPMFSDSMRLIVFKPFWNVPESIKFKELQPQLLRSSGSLERAGLRAEINGRVVDSSQVDWVGVDMRQVHIFQPPGQANALGQVKFLFPNRHDVYLHDTPTKHLFAQSVRAYSHGCMRVRDPLKLAEVILSNDKGWTRAQVDKQANSGPDNTEIKLTTPIPIHITYFTAWVDGDDKLQTVADIYGHESRIQMGIEGKAHLIAQSRGDDRPAQMSIEDRRRIAQQFGKKSSDPVGDWVKNIFSF